jgi:hypothetical protein
VANGLFTIDLDFGLGTFTGTQLYLDVSVDGNALTPRQALNSVPVAQYALSAATAQSTASSSSTNQFQNDHLYAGVGITSSNLPMVMQTNPALSGTSTETGYSKWVDVYSLTSAISDPYSPTGGSGKAQANDVRVLAKLDPAFTGIAAVLFPGSHFNNLQIDVLQSVNSGIVVESFCYGGVVVTALQPMPQAGVFEMTIFPQAVTYRFPTGTPYSWSFVTNNTTTSQCIK